MHTWIALLRGINVGGHNTLPMANLRAVLTDLGYHNPRSYIQSGNCAFETGDDGGGGDPEGLAATLRGAIQARFGFAPHVLILSPEDLASALRANPYPDARADPKSLHLYFLARPAADADLSALEALKAPREAFTLTESVFYLYAPDGIGRSKLAAKAERLLGVPVTARNLGSAQKIAQMAG